MSMYNAVMETCHCPAMRDSPTTHPDHTSVLNCRCLMAKKGAQFWVLNNSGIQYGQISFLKAAIISQKVGIPLCRKKPPIGVTSIIASSLIASSVVPIFAKRLASSTYTVTFYGRRFVSPIS